MKFFIENKNETVISFARKIGYRPFSVSADDEYSLIKPLSQNNYPRFHIYVKKEGDIFNINLHLDQKQPSYKGSGAHDHSGEYEGDIVENEAERIKKQIAEI